MRLLGLTQGVDAPSTRFRWTQHVEALSNAGFRVETLHARFGAYPPRSRLQRPFWGLATLADATARALKARSQADLCLLQRHLVSTLVTAEYLLPERMVFDVDDAIFLGTRGSSATRISRRAALTICGNQFLAEHFGQHGPVTVLPTAVDTERFVPGASRPARPLIGWSGSSSGFPYLYAIEPALKALLQMHPDLMLRVIADRPPEFSSLPAERVEFVRWSPATEVESLQELSIGLMPLEDSLWARGKCSFKMLTYMACALPVVVSPVGMNSEVLALGKSGLAATSSDDWLQAMDSLLRSDAERTRMGAVGRQVVQRHYSRAVISARLAGLLHGLR